jgi:hypothetical protein
MLAAAKYIGAGVACSGLIGAGLDYLTLILNILGITIIIITLVIIVLKGGKCFIDGIRTAAANTKLTVLALPAVVNVVSYGLILKTYINRVHNRPFDIGLSKSELNIQRITRKNQLAFFFVLGAPLVLSLL